MAKDNVSFFDIFGPVMIGPSSSHTAGIARIAFLTRKMFGGPPGGARIRFYGSLAATWKGHGSGAAAVAGLLGLPPEDERLSRGWEILEAYRAEGRGFPVEIEEVHELPPTWHPNSVVIELTPVHTGEGEPGRLTLRASSIGGGSIRIDEIDGFAVNLSGELEALLALHHDEVGVIAEVSRILAAAGINIAGTASHRREKGEEALLVVEADGVIPPRIITELEALPPVYRVIRIPSINSPDSSPPEQ